ncbi:ATP-dependent DNA helicase [Mycena chlorophos]|uniref:ATP-dependent DNA helicase n=1 Tax=Mycena chlorophos TaxID=658473 RepID=A0A8H6S8W7_MYCCL|nr:ATP-dependent DNA helicase [Mycena chlorophos]
MILRFNPPTIWATINLADTADPIAQVLAGQEIDLDQFVATAGPDSNTRSRTIAADPYAAAEFFHVVIRVILEEMFGITVNARGAITRRIGIMGRINAYIGTVEAQARGTLHLHILFWLEGAPTASVMKDALTSEQFRAKMRDFIAQNIRAHLAGTDADEEEDAICTITRNEKGEFVLKDQLREYQDRGSELESMNFYDYFSKTYDGKIIEQNSTPNDEDIEDDAPVSAGRPPSKRVPYLSGTRPKRCRVIRKEGTTEYYSAQMLLLIKPWRKLGDLPGTARSFEGALKAHMADAPDEQHRLLANIQYFYDCSDGARQRREEGGDEERRHGITEAGEILPMTAVEEPTEDDVARARRERFAARERMYGAAAVDIAMRQGIFREDYPVERPRQAFARQATADDMVKYHEDEEEIGRRTESAAENEDSKERDVQQRHKPRDVASLSSERRRGTKNTAQHCMRISPGTRAFPSWATGTDWEIRGIRGRICGSRHCAGPSGCADALFNTMGRTLWSNSCSASRMSEISPSSKSAIWRPHADGDRERRPVEGERVETGKGISPHRSGIVEIVEDEVDGNMVTVRDEVSEREEEIRMDEVQRTFVEGDEVRVVSGFYRGVRGTVIKALRLAERIAEGSTCVGAVVVREDARDGKERRIMKVLMQDVESVGMHMDDADDEEDPEPDARVGSATSGSWAGAWMFGGTTRKGKVEMGRERGRASSNWSRRLRRRRSRMASTSTWMMDRGNGGFGLIVCDR